MQHFPRTLVAVEVQEQINGATYYWTLAKLRYYYASGLITLLIFIFKKYISEHLLKDVNLWSSGL